MEISTDSIADDASLQRRFADLVEIQVMTPTSEGRSKDSSEIRYRSRYQSLFERFTDSVQIYVGNDAYFRCKDPKIEQIYIHYTAVGLRDPKIQQRYTVGSEA